MAALKTSNVIHFANHADDCMSESEMYGFVVGLVCDREEKDVKRFVQLFEALQQMIRRNPREAEDRLVYLQKIAFAETASFSEAFDAFCRNKPEVAS